MRKPCQAQSIARQHLLSWEISHPAADEAQSADVTVPIAVAPSNKHSLYNDSLSGKKQRRGGETI